MELNKYIDHTNLKPDMTHQDLMQLIAEAKEYQFKSVCINPCFVKQAALALANSDVLVCSVIGFPLGANTTNIKVLEASEAVANGADEIDMVINISKLKDQDYDYVLNEINQIKAAIGDKCLKVIVETCLLTPQELEIVAKIVLNSNADFIKTSTGMSSAGAQIKDVELFKTILNGQKEIKAAGGIRSYEDAISFINAGATRLGTSGGVNIIKGIKYEGTY